MKKILLTGGGSAGHVTPNLSLIEALQERGFQCYYVGRKNSIEQSIVNEAFPEVKFFNIRAGKLRRYFSLQNFLDIFNVFIGFLQSLFHIFRLKPDYIFSKGGFVPTPVVIAGYMLKVKVFIHESDSSPGLATKICARFAHQIFVSQESAIDHFKKSEKVVLVKLPIRSFLYKGDKNSIKFKDKSKQTLLIMGGSLGAKTLNDFLINNFNALTQTFNIIHLTGKDHFENMPNQDSSYLKFDFVQSQLADIYAKSDLVLCRAGATTLAEISELNKPSILVPLPKNQSRGEQITNALEFTRYNQSQIINDSDLNLASFNLAYQNLSKGNSKVTKNLPLIIDFFV